MSDISIEGGESVSEKWKALHAAQNIDKTRKNNAENIDKAREFKLFVEKEANEKTNVDQQLAGTENVVEAKKRPSNPFGIPS